MSLDDLGDAIAEGAVDGLASSLPGPPLQPGLPPPPSTGGRDDGPGSPPSDDEETPRAIVPVALALALIVLVVVGGFALVSWARGAPCDEADFRSTRFGYCASTPAGWIAEAAQEEGAPLDRFMLQDGAAIITVTAVPLTRGQDLARFEQFVRGYDESAGATTSGSRDLEVDGVGATAFDVTLEGPDGDVRSREVLFTREGVAWRVTLADERVGFEASARRLAQLLESWRFA